MVSNDVRIFDVDPISRLRLHFALVAIIENGALGEKTPLLQRVVIYFMECLNSVPNVCRHQLNSHPDPERMLTYALNDTSLSSGDYRGVRKLRSS